MFTVSTSLAKALSTGLQVFSLTIAVCTAAASTVKITEACINECDWMRYGLALLPGLSPVLHHLQYRSQKWIISCVKDSKDGRRM